MTLLVSLAFFLSGVAGLIYETVWARYLGLFLGHQAYAQALVLVIFLGGTSAGALGAAAATNRSRRPLLAYAGAEAVIGLLALVFHKLFVGATHLAYDSLFPALQGKPALVLLAQWIIAAFLILPQSVLLGTTYPLVSAALLRRRRDGSGRILALLYAMNAAGGALGVLIAGFWLVGSYGLPGATFAGGALSLATAVLAAAAWWRCRAENLGSSPRARLDSPNVQPLGSKVRTALLGVAFCTAVTSLAYEVAWTRLLSLLLGSASHSFELMLSAFVLGMALGAFWLRARVDRFVDAVGALGVVQWVMGALAIVSLPLYLAAFHWTADLLTALTPTPQGYALFTAARYGLCLGVMLPATFCAGITLPILTEALLRITRDEKVVGIAYGINTAGAIAGVLLAALVLMPIVGTRGLLVCAALGDMALGALLLGLRRAPKRRRATIPWAAAAATLLVVFGTAWYMPFDRSMIASGVYRTRTLPAPGLQKILFYEDGRTATVSAAYTPPGRTTISTNGKVDASLDDAWYHELAPDAPRRTLGDDAGTQTLMPIIGLAHVPTARRAAVIGHGSGMSGHFLLGSPNIESITTVEIEPQMILGSTVFYPVNRRVFDDPRSHFVNADARSFFSSTQTRYDLIISEPSNPWVSGVSSLFTQEFYARVARSLSHGGLFVQWVQMYETSDALLLEILASVHRRFGSYALYYTGAVDLLIVASTDTVLPTPDWSIVHWPALAHDLRDFVAFTPQSLDALRFGDRAVFAPLLDRATSASSDFRSALDRDAEEERYLGHTAAGFATLGSERFDPFMALGRHRFPIGSDTATPMPEVQRAHEAAIAARMHLPTSSSTRLDADANAVLMRVHMFNTFIATGEPPDDWHVWVRNFTLVERNVHGLASGVVDENFYTRVNTYLRRAHAPPEAVQAVAFHHALAAWDFRAAAAAADQLLPSIALGINWVPAVTLRDGAVVSKLLIGDTVGARQVFEMLTPPVERGSLRARLLDAHLRAAEGSFRRPSG